MTNKLLGLVSALALAGVAVTATTELAISVEPSNPDEVRSFAPFIYYAILVFTFSSSYIYVDAIFHSTDRSSLPTINRFLIPPHHFRFVLLFLPGD